MTITSRHAVTVDDQTNQPLRRPMQCRPVVTQPITQPAPERQTRPLQSNPRDPFPGLVTR